MHLITNIMFPTVFWSSVAAAPLAFMAPDSQTMNAALGTFAVGGLAALTAGKIIAHNKKKAKNAEAGYKEPSALSRLSSAFNRNKKALALVGCTALAGYIGAETVQDVRQNDRAVGFAFAGAVVDTVYEPARFIAQTGTSIGQFVTQNPNLNPVPPESHFTNPDPLSLDRFFSIAHDVIENEPTMAGDPANKWQRRINPIVDRDMPRTDR